VLEVWVLEGQQSELFSFDIAEKMDERGNCSLFEWRNCFLGLHEVTTRDDLQPSLSWRLSLYKPYAITLSLCGVGGL